MDFLYILNGRNTPVDLYVDACEFENTSITSIDMCSHEVQCMINAIK